jgi:predicted porin
LLSLGLTFAQTTLYGTVDQAWNTSTTKQGGSTIKDTTGFAPIQLGGGVLGVKGSEDLSGGLTASYVIEMQPAIDEDSSGTNGMWNRQSFVGLSGGFGAVRIGKQYSQAFNNTVGVDPGGATGIAGNNAYVIQLAYLGVSAAGDAPLRQRNGMQYDLPEMLPGLKAGATLVYGTEENSANGGKTNEGHGFNISYASGPIYAGYTFDRVKNTGIGIFSSPGRKLTYTAPNNVSIENTTYDVADASSSDQNEFTTMSASYNLGVAKISINNSKMSVGSKSIDNTFVAVSVPFGGNANVWASAGQGSAYRPGNISFGATADASSNSSNTVAGDKGHESYQLGVNYALSKRTVLYAQHGKMELKDTTKFEQTGTALGVHHSF